MRSHLGHRKDANQNSIQQELQKCGLFVLDMSSFGAGFPDLLVCDGRKIKLIEIKQPGEKLTPREEKFHKDFPNKQDIVVATNTEQVLIAFGLMP